MHSFQLSSIVIFGLNTRADRARPLSRCTAVCYRWRGMALRLAIGVAFVLSTSPLAVQAAQFTSPTAGYRLTYPDAWRARLHGNGRDVVAANFPDSVVPEGGFVPPGGVTIIVNSFPPWDHPYVHQGSDDYDVLDKIAHNETILTRTTRSSGQPAHVASDDALINLRTVTTIIHRAQRTFFVMLWCNADDPKAAAYDRIFDDVVASITVIDATPTPAARTP